MQVPTNESRAESAQQAIEFFTVSQGIQGEPLDAVIGDLLANLMHFCDSEGLDFDLLINRAQINHNAEIGE